MVGLCSGDDGLPSSQIPNSPKNIAKSAFLEEVLMQMTPPGRETFLDREQCCRILPEIEGAQPSVSQGWVLVIQELLGVPQSSSWPTQASVSSTL